ncbi:uncharacterized protein LOC132747263 isoform X3 [Ruditapes philippinarum]|uniref:uncharacterized protein LOC132747263 isoform X3 n=1 Tax=Ruditapes philippinarum TaxID=129788 RepID=UPI00295AD2E6|nr:uncharacterized protein LOC132747263 isoform X3 [Ruditapes philippinarum]
MEFKSVIQLLVCVVCCTSVLGQDNCNDTETPSIKMCQTTNRNVRANTFIYLDSGGAPILTKVECTCTLRVSGSGSFNVEYRAIEQITNCEVDFTMNDRTWGCQTEQLSVQYQGSNNLTFIKKFNNRRNWLSCLGIMTAQHDMTVECYPYRIYYAPDEVVDGGFSDWSFTSECSVTCGTGVRTRERRCNNPYPRNNGSECLAEDGTRTLVETGSVSCESSCEVNGAWGPWINTSSCSTTCGTGSLTQTRSCDSPAPNNDGEYCLTLGGNRALEENRTIECFIIACPVNGDWGPWINTSSCSTTCGTGSLTQSRSCDSPTPSNGGEECLTLGGDRALAETRTVTCFEMACPASVDGNWSDWGQWTTCSKLCGGGTRSQTRTCTNPSPANGGLPCPGDSSQAEDCNTNACAGTGQTTSSQAGFSSETPVTQASVDKKRKEDDSNMGAIIGGTVGGLLLLLLLLLLLVCFIRRRRRKEVKRRPSEGDRSVRYISQGDDVTVTENQLYNYDGETPSHAVNALFVGGIPETPQSPGYIPHFSTDTGDRYAVIMDSNRTKPKTKERPKLDTFNSQEENAKAEPNGDVRASTDTVKLAENYNDDQLGRGVDNPGYEDSYIAPYDSAEGGTKPKTSSSSPSPYDYIDNEKLKRDDADFEDDKLAGDYATLPDDGNEDGDNDAENNERYKRFISSEPEDSADDGYLKSPKRDNVFEFPDTS